MEPVFFKNRAELRSWFEQYHAVATELLVGYYKVSTKRESLTWSQSVDEALCFGWIDGIRRSINEDSYCIRFTPRKPDSTWSAVNIQKVEELRKLGLMHDAGLEVYLKRRDDKSTLYTYEFTKQVKLDKGFEKQFMANVPAWKYFQSQAPSYRKIAYRWVMSAKQEITRQKRLNELIQSSAAGEIIKAMRYGRK